MKCPECSKLKCEICGKPIEDLKQRLPQPKDFQNSPQRIEFPDWPEYGELNKHLCNGGK